MRCNKKRSFQGNRHTRSQGIVEDVISQQTEQGRDNINDVPPAEQSTPIPIIQGTPSSSASKIDLSVYDSMAEGDSINISGPSSQTQNTSSNINTSCMYMITDIKIFLDLLQLVGNAHIAPVILITLWTFHQRKALPRN